MSRAAHRTGGPEVAGYRPGPGSHAPATGRWRAGDDRAFRVVGLTSLKTLGESFRVPPTIFPSELQWGNYAEVFTQLPFLAFYENTIIVTAVKVVGSSYLLAGGYAFARIDFPGRNILFALYLAVLMVPYQIFLLPQFLIMAKLGLVNTLAALIILAFDAFGTFLMRQFFKGFRASWRTPPR